jgi:bifunctional UDP-N-acetylglucosamine pyrophosphorylase/glucosamine-1-phosphate N-acetyltransferase
VVGEFSIVKRSVIMDHTNVPHLNYVADSLIGSNCNLGAGTVTANLRFDERSVKVRIKGKKVDSGRRKLGVIMGDNCKTGINVSLMPGVKVGPNSVVGPGVVLYEDLAPGRSIFVKR